MSGLNALRFIFHGHKIVPIMNVDIIWCSAWYSRSFLKYVKISVVINSVATTRFCKWITESHANDGSLNTVVFQVDFLLSINNLYEKFQSGFNPQRRTDTALIRVTNNLLIKADSWVYPSSSSAFIREQLLTQSLTPTSPSVPKGSVIGTILFSAPFLIFQKIQAHCHCYTDDTELHILTKLTATLPFDSLNNFLEQGPATFFIKR